MINSRFYTSYCVDRPSLKNVPSGLMVENFLLKFVLGATDDFDTLMVYDKLIEDMYNELCD